MSKEKVAQGVDPQDPRWSGYVPWFLRHADFSTAGDFDTFFERLRQILARLFKFNELSISNPQHFCARLETESLQRFKYSDEFLQHIAIAHYFNPATMRSEATARMHNDSEEQAARAFEIELRQMLGGGSPSGKTLKTPAHVGPLKDAKNPADMVRHVQEQTAATREHRTEVHLRPITLDRIATLEALLRIVPQAYVTQVAVVRNLLRDIHRAMAECGIPLRIDEKEMSIIPVEEPLLQREVLDRLLPRLSARFPEGAHELIKAYHDLIQGTDGNKVFGNAFKALESIARGLTNDEGLMLSKREHLAQYFSKLHPTIHETILKLAGHRGDEGGHGGKGPEPHEMRYLLFAICNVALLFLEYPDYTS